MEGKLGRSEPTQVIEKQDFESRKERTQTLSQDSVMQERECYLDFHTATMPDGTKLSDVDVKEIIHAAH